MTRDVRKTGKGLDSILHLLCEPTTLSDCSGQPGRGGVKKLPRLRLNFRLSSFEWRCLVRHFTI